MKYIVYYNRNGNVCQLNYSDYTVAKRRAIDESIRNGSAQLYEIDTIYGGERHLATYANGEKW